MSQSLQTFIDHLSTAFEAGDPGVGAKTLESANVHRLQELYRAFARGDFDAIVATTADDIELEIVGPPAELGFVCQAKGRTDVLAALQQNFSQVEDQQPETLSLVAQGDSVVVIARETGKVRATGSSYELHWVQLFQFRDGKVAVMREFTGA